RLVASPSAAWRDAASGRHPTWVPARVAALRPLGQCCRLPGEVAWLAAVDAAAVRRRRSRRRANRQACSQDASRLLRCHPGVADALAAVEPRRIWRPNRYATWFASELVAAVVVFVAHRPCCRTAWDEE